MVLRGRRALVLLSRLASARALVLPPLTLPPTAFSPTASWLVPGHVLVGRYPGSCPSRPVDAATQRARIAAIRANATTFVSLQAEIPPQDAEWPAGGVGAQSGNAVRRQTEKFRPYYADAGGAEGEARFLHLAIEDRSVAPTLEALDAAVLTLRDRVMGGEVLYVHCWGGRGRTGLVAACLLGALYPGLVDAEAALARVQASYSAREPGRDPGSDAAGTGGRSPETEAQRQQVRDWFERARAPAARL